ncbi:MAG: immunoglobulin-like domain-containing protein [Bacteroidia bacterium]
MNKIYGYIFVILLVVASASCRRDFDTENVSKIVKVSYPTIALKGDSVVSLTVGTPYNDAGAILTDDISGAKSDIGADADSKVDVNTPGLYFITYTAANANGFETRISRPVVVTDVPESADLSGTYVRTANGAPATWTKIARGLYINDNVGGVPPPSPAVLPVYVGHLNDSTITIPVQDVPNGYGTLYVTGAKLSISASDTSYTYVVRNIGFGAAPRTFSKQ